MARLPQPGADNGTWGQVLNEFLDVSHDSNGSIKADAINSTAIQDGSISGAKLQNDSVTNAKLNAGSGIDGQVLTKDVISTGGFKWSSPSGGPAATNASLGTIQLAGDLGGSATAPTVPGLATKEPSITAGSTTQYYRGDKTWQTLDKTAVGLANVNDTSDANKPVSTAQQTALDGKTNTANGGGELYFDAGNSGAAITLNLANGNVQKLTLTANCTLTLAAPAAGAYRTMLLYVFQDGIGSRTITWPGSVLWGATGAPILSTGLGKMDKILLDTVDGGVTWYGAAGPGGY